MGLIKLTAISLSPIFTLAMSDVILAVELIFKKGRAYYTACSKREHQIFILKKLSLKIQLMHLA